MHQKLDFKDGDYRVSFQGSPDLLVLERAGKALIALNDNGVAAQSATLPTSFGPNVRLHDYKGAGPRATSRPGRQGRHDLGAEGELRDLAPAGFGGGFEPPRRRTTQEFQLDDDLGERPRERVGYGGRIRPVQFRTAGAIWAAAGTPVKVEVFTDGARSRGARESG